MRSTPRVVGSVLALVTALVLPLLGSSASASAGATAPARTWQLEKWDLPQRMCVLHNSGDGVHRSYLIFAVTGQWSTDLDFGMRDLPPGWTALQSHLPPGSNHPDPDDGGVMVNGWISVQGPTSVPMGVYRPLIWVSDGVVTDTAAVEIVVSTASWLECMQDRG
ncbi:DUF5980 family protein [Actinosynnema sp. NPDC004786]